MAVRLQQALEKADCDSEAAPSFVGAYCTLLAALAALAAAEAGAYAPPASGTTPPSLHPADWIWGSMPACSIVIHCDECHSAVLYSAWAP